jgi:PilZ domain
MENAETRVAKRQKVLKSAKLVFNSNGSVIDCTVKDMSSTGARLICKDSRMLPDEVRFLLSQDNTIRDVRIIWRRGELLGIHFLTEAQRAPARKF